MINCSVIASNVMSMTCEKEYLFYILETTNNIMKT
ncbi:hypothetical protein NIES4071_88500 [Calothrix sp. NIES-4071]|nr:hypothetical protein NIES4071_88500 [Calothrix sp. NIES-4071]BAZ63117.1 hypothetical protein NIES4105_88430 [Calothrix sp. NIES-4105]